MHNEMLNYELEQSRWLDLDDDYDDLFHKEKCNVVYMRTVVKGRRYEYFK